MNISFLSNRGIDILPKARNLSYDWDTTSSGLACRDPFILPLDGKYYLYKNDGMRIVCLVSPDLEHWSAPITVFDPPAGFHGVKNLFWAPECHFYKGAFYIFTSVFSSIYNHRTISVYRATDPTGPFEDIAGGCITPPDWDAIDGTFYLDREGKPWMIFVHEWTSMPDHNGRMAAARLSDDLTHFVSEPIDLFGARDASWATSGVTDGPYMLRTDSNLFMIWSNFGKNGYTVGLARSDSGEIDGNFIQLDKPLYEKGLRPDFVTDGGHAMIFSDFSGKLLLALHGPNNQDGSNYEHLQLFELCEENNIPSIK